MASLEYMTVHEAHDGLMNGDISSVELTRACLERIAAVEERVKAFVTVTADLALQQAEEADRRIAEGNGQPLTGIPMQIKDVMCTKGVRTTCSSRMLEDYIPVYDATATANLLEQGAVLLGKGNMDEFAMGSSTENSAFFATRNPWNQELVPGGSSGGPAAATAAGEALFSLGSDTGGSIRQPAAFCGIVGLKPTYGLVSRYGLVAFASSLDQIGPLARDVTDCAMVLNAIAGHDPRDSTSLPVQYPDYTEGLTGDISGVRLGVPQEYFVDGMDPGSRKAVEAAIQALEGLGASVTQVSLPTTRYALSCYYIIAPSECSANLARYDGVKYGFAARDADSMWADMEKTRQLGFGPEVTRRVMLGAYALSAGYYDAYYLKAQQARTLIQQDFAQVFKEVDALVAPVSPTAAFPLGEKTSNPVQMYLSDVCTLPPSIAGLPCMSVPCGFDQGLPVGLQLIGPHLSEQTLLRVAYAYEQATDWRQSRPPL